VVYDFSPSRAGEHARNFLGTWNGKLVCDDFAGYKASFELGITEIIQGKKSMPQNLPDDPQLLKLMLAKMQSRVGFLEEENALLRQRLFGRKSEQTADSAMPQLALFNETESIADARRRRG
jgi:hypothetical protein